MLSPSNRKFISDLITDTPLLKMTGLLIVLWLLFSAGVYWGESSIAGSSISSYGKALYWGVAAFSTAGIADMPLGSFSQLFGALWIVIGSMLFFGAIVATITAYFMRPLQTPPRQIIDIIEYNLERLDDLTVDELKILKSTVDALIVNMERVSARKIKLQLPSDQ